MEQITKRLAAALLPERKADGHKGSFGKVCVIGGSVGYTGAPVYAAEGLPGRAAVWCFWERLPRFTPS